MLHLQNVLDMMTLQNIWVTKPNSSEKKCYKYKIQGY